MPDFDVKVTITVTNVPTEQDAIGVVQKMIERGGVGKGKITFVPVPRDVDPRMCNDCGHPKRLHRSRVTGMFRCQFCECEVSGATGYEHLGEVESDPR